MKLLCLLSVLAATTIPCGAQLLIADMGVAISVIVVDPNATAPERSAAAELAATLQQITGASFSVRTNTEAPDRAILVGVARSTP
ncbi:MAG: hypothetical protein O2960_24235 [Verrucomicrobia bacterium]|nr:hypothetical protein [Verrucomicrobiota bacterium]